MDYAWEGVFSEFVAIAVFLVITLIPWFIAKRRGDPHASSVLIIALFSGWTFIGWVLALAFAARGNNWSTPETVKKQSKLEAANEDGLNTKETTMDSEKNTTNKDIKG